MNTNEINTNSKMLELLLDRAVLDVMVWTHYNCVSCSARTGLYGCFDN